MRLLTQGTVCHVLRLNNGIEIMFSYGMPVAGILPGKGYFQTDVHYSNTTTKHINAYVNGMPTVLSQKAIDCLLIP